MYVFSFMSQCACLFIHESMCTLNSEYTHFLMRLSRELTYENVLQCLGDECAISFVHGCNCTCNTSQCLQPCVSRTRTYYLRYTRSCNTKGIAYTMQHTATHCMAATALATLKALPIRCNTLQHTATHCMAATALATLKALPIQCNTLQHTATHCNHVYLGHVRTVSAYMHCISARDTRVPICMRTCVCHFPVS